VTFAAQGYNGSPDIYQFLAYLAVVEPKAAPSIVDELPLSDAYTIVLTARPRGSIPNAQWKSSYFLFVGNS
jgi:hypothetical protein